MNDIIVVCITNFKAKPAVAVQCTYKLKSLVSQTIAANTNSDKFEKH